MNIFGPNELAMSFTVLFSHKLYQRLAEPIYQRMDVARFSMDNFDPKEWINSTLQTEPGQSKEAAAGSLVMKLQLMIARINTALEEQCSAVVQSVPRIVREAEQLEQEAGLLRDKLVGVKADVAKVEAETAENMGALVRMDLVKERVAGTRRALQEADNWTSLDSQVDHHC